MGKIANKFDASKFDKKTYKARKSIKDLNDLVGKVLEGVMKQKVTDDEVEMLEDISTVVADIWQKAIEGE